MTTDDHDTKTYRIDVLVEERGAERTRAKARI